MIQIVLIDFADLENYWKFSRNLDPIGELIVDNIDVLDDIADYRKARKLSDFIADYIESDDNEIGSAGKWFAVSQGVATLNATLEYLQAPQEIAISKAIARKVRRMRGPVVEELEELHEQLVLAEQLNCKAHFKLVAFKVIGGYPVIVKAPKVFPQY